MTTPRCVLCGRPEDEATPSFSYYLHTVKDSRCPECGKPQGVDHADVERELAELRTAIADAAAVMSSIYDSFRDGEKIDPAAVDIGIGCWLEKHAPEVIALREERDEALRLLATRVEAKRLDEAQEEIERLRSAQSEDTPPTCEFCDKLRCACVKQEPAAFRRLRSCLEFDERAPIEAVIEAALQRFDYDFHLVGENARLRVACTLALGIMEQKNRVAVLPTAKFVDVKFAPEDIAVLRAALEKK